MHTLHAKYTSKYRSVNDTLCGHTSNCLPLDLHLGVGIGSGIDNLKMKKNHKYAPRLDHILACRTRLPLIEKVRRMHDHTCWITRKFAKLI